MNTESTLKGLDNLAKYSYNEILEQNLIAFFDWGFLNKSGFINVNIPQSGAYGGDFSRLRPVTDERYTSGKVWEAIRGNWVWESGLEAATNPIAISGLFINSTFYPASGNTYSIDYPNGRILFNSPIAKSSVVRLAYSYKWINVTSSDNIPWLRVVQQKSQRVDDSNFLSGSGDYSTYNEKRLQLPTIAVEIIDERYQGYEIGGSQKCINRVKFYIIGEDKLVDRIAHTIAKQNEKTIFLFDSNRMATENRFPLTYNGSIANNALTYPQLTSVSGIGGYRLNRDVMGGKLTFLDSNTSPKQYLTNNISQKVVTFETEAVLTNI